MKLRRFFFYINVIAAIKTYQKLIPKINSQFITFEYFPSGNIIAGKFN